MMFNHTKYLSILESLKFEQYEDTYNKIKSVLKIIDKVQKLICDFNLPNYFT